MLQYEVSAGWYHLISLLCVQYRSKVSYQSRLVSRERRESRIARRESRIERRESRLERRESRLARITEAEILEYYQVSREKN